MNDEHNDMPPDLIYYATIKFRDGAIETPQFLVFDDLSTGVGIIKEHYKNLERPLERLVMKEALFIDTRVMPEDTHILVPSNDKGVADDFRDPLEQQEMVASAEEGDTEEGMLSLLPYEQEGDSFECRAFYMGPFHKAKSVDDFVTYLQRNPFEVSQPVDYLWLYRPTGEWKEVKV